MNNKDADQPAHPRSLISIFVIRRHGSVKPYVATSEIPRLLFLSAHIPEQAGLSLINWTLNSEDSFL